MPIVTFGIVASGVLAFFGAVMLHKSESQRESAERELQNCRTRLHRVSSQLDEIVISEGEDAGVILLSSDSPTHYDADKRCQVYDNEYFSPLGKALVSVASVARGDGAIL
ncbi:MAG: hypothetical protein E6Q97_09725 [Desulfurellales bacterium]|nr:MAG: hypothetical protein E6Q97_09725 [Desulfurellales bacterium]